MEKLSHEAARTWAKLAAIVVLLENDDPVRSERAFELIPRAIMRYERRKLKEELGML